MWPAMWNYSNPKHKEMSFECTLHYFPTMNGRQRPDGQHLIRITFSLASKKRHKKYDDDNTNNHNGRTKMYLH